MRTIPHWIVFAMLGASGPLFGQWGFIAVLVIGAVLLGARFAGAAEIWPQKPVLLIFARLIGNVLWILVAYYR